MASLSQSLHKAPPKKDRPYTFTGETAEVLGGGLIGQARNAPKKGEPDDFLTYENGQTQQSCPYRAVAQAVASDILPAADIVAVWVDAKRVSKADGEKIAAMLSK